MSTRATRAAKVAVLGVTLLASSCVYSFRAGSFPPPHIRTIAIELFDNDTPRFELTAEIYDRRVESFDPSIWDPRE